MNLSGRLSEWMLTIFDERQCRSEKTARLEHEVSYFLLLEFGS